MEEKKVNNLEIWDKVKTPHPDALKKITGGRLKGMTDISPQWRFQCLTKIFGPCGIGWNYSITSVDFRDGGNNEVACFATIDFKYKKECEWSGSIVGVGGSMFITKEKNGLYTSDEAIKMAVTDAISVAAKQIGVAADVYMNNMDGSRYRQPEPPLEIPEPDEVEAVAIEAIWMCLKESASEGMVITQKSVGDYLYKGKKAYPKDVDVARQVADFILAKGIERVCEVQNGTT